MLLPFVCLFNSTSRDKINNGVQPKYQVKDSNYHNVCNRILWLEPNRQVLKMRKNLKCELEVTEKKAKTITVILYKQ